MGSTDRPHWPLTGPSLAPHWAPQGPTGLYWATLGLPEPTPGLPGPPLAGAEKDRFLVKMEWLPCALGAHGLPRALKASGPARALPLAGAEKGRSF